MRRQIKILISFSADALKHITIWNNKIKFHNMRNEWYSNRNIERKYIIIITQIQNA